MKFLLRLLLGLIAVLGLAIGGLVIGARFSDGPIVIVAGGPFESGERVGDEPLDLEQLAQTQEVEFQLLDPARSRITWLVVHDGKAYIPSGYMTTWWGKLWKHWPAEAEQDGRILLRADGKIYERELVRIQSGPAVGPVIAELSRKYFGGADVPIDAVSSGNLWLFEVAPRS